MPEPVREVAAKVEVVVVVLAAEEAVVAAVVTSVVTVMVVVAVVAVAEGEEGAAATVEVGSCRRQPDSTPCRPLTPHGRTGCWHCTSRLPRRA